MSETMADLKLGLDAIELKSRAEKVGFVDVEADRIDDAYVVERPGGKKAELPLFVLHARALPLPRDASNSKADALSSVPSPLSTLTR